MVMFLTINILGWSQIAVTYTSNNTFVVPAGVTEITVECWGGGGRGGSRTSDGRGGGGGGGAYSRSVLTGVSGSYTVTVGSGSSSDSQAGGDSWFGTATTVMAKGGGTVGNNNTNGANGGSAAAGFGQVKFSGGDGANAPGSSGGGGGSSAGTAANGADATSITGASAPAGGGSGGNGRNGDDNGFSGSAPGGGGGGAERDFSTRTGGNGGPGQVVVSYNIEGICMSAISANAIPDNSGYISFDIPVSGLPTTLGTGPGNARLESVEFIISHATNDQLDITLTSAAGTTRNLSNDRFGSGDNYGNPASCPGSAFVMRDGTAALTNSNTNNPTGPYSPAETLAGFTGNPNGTWSLNIRDDANGTTGNLRYVKLNFCVLPELPVITSNSPICAGTALTLSATSTGATGFTWSGTGTFSPNNTSAAVSVTGATSGTYTVTASNTCGPVNAVANVTVKPLPTGVSATPSASSACAGSTIDLTGAGSGTANILTADFNSGAGGWTNTTTGSSGGTIANAAWTLRANGYVTDGSTFNSNDATQFYMTNSDLQGSGSTTQTTLVSPAFSTVGYTSLSLSFFHFFRDNGSDANDAGRVETSTDGVNWTVRQTYTGANFGSSSAFAPATLDLSSVAGQASVRIRFRFNATWDWWWAIDNVNLEGTGTGALTWAWTSTPSGFNSAQQSPSAVTVNTSRDYILTATANGCSVTANTGTVTAVTPPNAGSNNTLTICSNAAAADMGALLGTHDAGSWSGPSAVIGDQYDPATMSPGNYLYTVTAAPCANATATIAVTENTATAWYADDDNDGFGDAAEMLLACTAPGGYVANNTDCDDSQVLYADNDGDGFGAGSPVACGVANDDDCDDSQILHADVDGDGFGAAANAPCGIADASDCDDSQLLYTDGDGDGFGAGAPVACGVTDNTDCNDAQIQYADGDGDGFGAGSPVACGVADNTDCNDAQLQYVDADGDGFGAGAPIACGVADNTDCNDSMVMYADNDGDGFGAGNPIACGGIADNTDCNDAEVQYADGDGDGFGAGSPVACGVANDDDCNDDELQYADTDGDGFGAGSPVACGVANNTDDCPSVVGLIGSNCDAQPGTGFVLGQLNGSCNCVAIACTQTVVLELRSDANSAQIGYEILDQNTELVICSGGAPNEPFPNGITTPITPSCCLPVGCYRLRVLDAGGDGFVSGGITGGYQLRESGANGRRIIDNLGNFTTGGTSAIASTYQNGAFCVPISNDRPIFTSCDKLDWVPNKFIVATPNDDVTAEFGSTNSTSGYDFWFFDPNGTYSFRRFRSHATSDGTGNGATRACHFRINGWANTISSPHIPADVLLNVRVRARVAGENRPYGPACLFKIDVVRAACPMVKLQDNPLNEDHSCGVSRQFGGSNSAANKLVAAAPQFTPTVASGNVRYQFRFRLPGEFPNPGSCIVRPIQSSPTLYLNWTNGDKLKCNTQYQVDVRVSKDGGATWCIADGEPTCSATPTVWGKVCNVNITTSNFCPGEVQGGSSNLSAQSEGDFTLYPNPNTGEQLFVNFSAVEKGTNTVNVDIFDMTGKRVIARTIAVQDGFVKASFDLNGDVQSGVYIVNVTAGTKTYTQRLVIQR